MADENRSFATNTASSNSSQPLGENGPHGAPDVDAVEAAAEADEDSAIAARRAEADRFQGSKTRQATKDIISRRG